MICSYKAKSLEPTKHCDRDFTMEQVTECPICKASIKPLHLNSVFFSEINNIYIESHEFCTNCNHSFVVCRKTEFNIAGSIVKDASIKSIEPQKYKKINFDKQLSNLSPQFVKIYNQASAAESAGLDEIAGLGYRKALEFLIKDFAIHTNPDFETNIKNMPLSTCINQYIDSTNIKTLALRSAWIGNDEAHYIRKQEDRDVQDMKRFISSTVYFISMILITEDAESMEPK